MYTHTVEAQFVPLSLIVFPFSLLQYNCSLRFLRVVQLLLFCFSPVVWFWFFTTHYAALSARDFSPIFRSLFKWNHTECIILYPGSPGEHVYIFLLDM